MEKRLTLPGTSEMSFNDYVSLVLNMVLIMGGLATLYLVLKAWIKKVAHENASINKKLDDNLITEKRAKQITDELSLIKYELKALNKKVERSLEHSVEAKTLARRALEIINTILYGKQ